MAQATDYFRDAGFVLDLSAVTDRILKVLREDWKVSPYSMGKPQGFDLSITGHTPDAMRRAGGSQLTLSLCHLDQDLATESLFWSAQTQGGGPRTPPVAFQPLALNLCYLLSAFDEVGYIHEQQAMSVAMKALHDHPLIWGTSVGGPDWELSLSMERCSYDELGRLWQSLATPQRLAAVYRASVALVEPRTPPPAAGQVEKFTVLAGSQSPLQASSRSVSYKVADGTNVSYQMEPATAAPGQQVWLTGSEMDTSDTDMVFLVDSSGGEFDVSPWVVTSPAPTVSRRILLLPAKNGVPPAATPSPGRYRLRLGHEGGGRSTRTEPVPISIAATVHAVGGPLLAGAAPFTVRGVGFLAEGATQIFLGVEPLRPVRAAPKQGEFAVGRGGTSLRFVPPDGLRRGRYQLHVRVNGVESDPALWLDVQ